MRHGQLVISLDFELMWGVRDKETVESYGQHILGVHEVLPRLLSVFDLYEVKATFATVGMLFFSNRDELLRNLPKKQPTYSDSNFSPYGPYISHLDFQFDRLHFAPDLVQLIKEHPQPEIGTHTFSHYYCLEDGQFVDQFEEDLVAAIRIAKEHGIETKSLVFPRNQSNVKYVEASFDYGITSYRGNENCWLYSAVKDKDETQLRRAGRLIDSYINLTGYHTYCATELRNQQPCNVPSSRFLRPYAPSLRFFDGLKLTRIKRAMTYAAKHNRMFHLWWHPHNFGVNREENFDFLEKVLAHYRVLHKQYHFQSVTMAEFAHIVHDYQPNLYA
jgi:peptidoglycan/xylan/chitin deacetylase (PgdA/CDA1 family)